MFLPDNVQKHLRQQNIISINEIVKKEGDLYVVVNVIDQQRRIIYPDLKLIESLLKQSNTTSRKNSGGLLKG